MPQPVRLHLAARQIEAALAAAPQIVGQLQLDVGDGPLERPPLPLEHANAQQYIEVVLGLLRRPHRGITRTGLVEVEKIHPLTPLRPMPRPAPRDRDRTRGLRPPSVYAAEF